MKKIFLLTSTLLLALLVASCSSTPASTTITELPSAATANTDTAVKTVQPTPTQTTAPVETKAKTTEETPLRETSNEPESSTKDQVATSSVKEFTIIAKDFKFTPGILTVNEGDTVKITITSEDVTHSFNLPAFNINQRLVPGETVTFEFTADKKGTHLFFCSIPCGSGHSGMNGKLIVE